MNHPQYVIGRVQSFKIFAQFFCLTWNQAELYGNSCHTKNIKV